VPIIEHADVKRMLLAQKAYVRGRRWRLSLYCARLVDEQHTGDAEAADDATAAAGGAHARSPRAGPASGAWRPTRLAIQVHGGYGYTRDFPVEQYWRDNRLNMIHEGTHGIQALDLLGRKVLHGGRAGVVQLLGRDASTATRAQAQAQPAVWPTHAQAVGRGAGPGAGCRHDRAHGPPAWPTRRWPTPVPYLQAFGHTVLVAWICAGRAAAAARRSPGGAQRHPGPVGRHPVFLHYELPKIAAWLAVVQARDMTCADFPEDAF